MRLALSHALLACALALPATSLLVASDAQASVSIAVGYDALVKDADEVVLVTPGDQQSVWEDGRIYTYTKFHVDQPIAGALPAGGEGFVRTMGGVVGNVGQMVDGEPVFTAGQQSMLFLHKLKVASTFEVSARAQGQYPLVVSEAGKMKTFMKSGNAGVILPPKTPPADNAAAAGQSTSVQSRTVTQTPVSKLRLASDVLHGRAMNEATAEVAAAWKKAHPATPPATAK